MTQVVKNDKLSREDEETEVEALNDRIKKLEDQIKDLINN